MPALGVTLTKKWSHRALGQLKNKTKAEWISHLDRDERWERAAQQTGGSPIVFQRVDDKSKTVSIHNHPKETYRSLDLVKDLLEKICWTEDVLLGDKFLK